MWLVETGTSADPRDTQVVCDCDRSLSLEQAFQKGRLGRCHGERPWLGDRDPAGCETLLRLLTRTATNTYFPQGATVISLPSAEDALSGLVQGHFSDLNAAQSPADIAQARRFNAALRASLEGYSDADVFARLQQLRTRRDQDASLPPKLAEFDVFGSGAATIGENLPGSLLYAETLRRDAWDLDDDPVLRPSTTLSWCIGCVRFLACTGSPGSRPRRLRRTVKLKMSGLPCTARHSALGRIGFLQLSSSVRASLSTSMRPH